MNDSTSPRPWGKTPEQRVAYFWTKVSVHGPEDCWEWQGGRLSQGYGRYWVGTRDVLAHVFAWEVTKGPVPDGLCVLHRCDNPPCCNPAHLFIGTRADNNADKIAKGRERWNPSRGDAHWTRRNPGAQRGERNPTAKLTDEQADEIRALYAAGDISQRALGERFGVCQPVISRIVRGTGYGNV